MINLKEQELKQKKKIKCAGGCGYILVAPHAFPEDSYCSKYCCGCCPDAKASPCQKEKQSGSILEQLARHD